MKEKIGVIGLGYVGLPLACLFAEKYEVTGYDVSMRRVEALKTCNDKNFMLTEGELKSAFDKGMRVTCDMRQLKSCDVYIVAVPTPCDSHNIPDLTNLVQASRQLGAVITKGNVVIYESTVYPGVTEEVCLPIIEEMSGLKFNEDFFAGYSPERINPGDTEHFVANVVKVTSGSTPETAQRVNALYGSVLSNETFMVSSMKVAEMVKVMENAQRDVNIAFMNEMSMIAGKMDIDMGEVMAAMRTKWNALPFTPGLVGGHCISVDPYYLIDCARSHDLEARLLVEARNVNEFTSRYVALCVISAMSENGVVAKAAHVLVLGFAFKEDTPDFRNTKVIDVVKTLRQHGCLVTICDPWVDTEEVKSRHGLDIVGDYHLVTGNKYDAVILCVRHHQWKDMDVRQLLKPTGVAYSVKKGGFLTRRNLKESEYNITFSQTR